MDKISAIRIFFSTHTDSMREEYKIIIKNMKRLFLIVAGVYLTMRYVLHLVLPFVFAFLVAAFLHPLERKIEHSCRSVSPRKHKLICTGIIVCFWLVLALVIAGVLAAVYKEGVQGCQYMMRYLKQQGGWECAARQWWEDGVDNICDRTGLHLQHLHGQYERIQSQAQSLLQKKVWPMCCEYFMGMGRQCLAVFAVVFVVVLSSLFFLNDFEKIKNQIRGTVLGKGILNLAVEMKEAGGAYVKAQFLIFSLISLVCISGLYLLRAEHAALIGILIGLCDALPFFGTGTVWIPWAIVRILQGRYVLAISYLFLYLLCSFLRNLLEPKLIGKGLGIHPIAVMMSVYAGLVLYGVSGIVLGPLSVLLIWKIYCFEL